MALVDNPAQVFCHIGGMFKKFPHWWAGIKALIFGVDPQAAIVLQQGEDAAKLHLKHAVTFVETLKQLVHNPGFDFISCITPFDWDDKFLARARAAIAKTLHRLKLVQAEINSTIHPHPHIATAFLASDVAYYMQQVDPETRHKFYAEVAARLANEKDSVTLTKDEKAAVEAYYTTEFKPTLAAAQDIEVPQNSIFYTPDNATTQQA